MPDGAPTEVRPAPAFRRLDRRSVGRSVAVGVVAGFLSGMFGVGGGILIVPALVALTGMPQRLAHGTSLAAVLPIALSSLAGYWSDDKIDWPVAGWLAVGAVLGAVLGTKLLNVLPHRALGLAFAALMLATALRLVLDTSSAEARSSLSAGWAVGLVLFGVVTGILSGLLGVGGGVVMVPFMVVLLGVPAAVAKGTSLAVVVPTSLMGTWRNRKRRNADLTVAAVVGIAGVVSAFVGSQISIGLGDTTSNALFAGLLTVIGLRLVIQLRNAETQD